MTKKFHLRENYPLEQKMTVIAIDSLSNWTVSAHPIKSGQLLATTKPLPFLLTSW